MNFSLCKSFFLRQKEKKMRLHLKNNILLSDELEFMMSRSVCSVSGELNSTEEIFEFKMFPCSVRALIRYSNSLDAARENVEIMFDVLLHPWEHKTFLFGSSQLDIIVPGSFCVHMNIFYMECETYTMRWKLKTLRELSARWTLCRWRSFIIYASMSFPRVVQSPYIYVSFHHQKIGKSAENSEFSYLSRRLGDAVCPGEYVENSLNIYWNC